MMKDVHSKALSGSGGPNLPPRNNALPFLIGGIPALVLAVLLASTTLGGGWGPVAWFIQAVSLLFAMGGLGLLTLAAREKVPTGSPPLWQRGVGVIEVAYGLFLIGYGVSERVLSYTILFALIFVWIGGILIWNKR